jgi:hypothetical protein
MKMTKMRSVKFWTARREVVKRCGDVLGVEVKDDILNLRALTLKRWRK